MLMSSQIKKPALRPADIEMLHAIIVEWCLERNCPLDSPLACEAAKEAISWFECGIKRRDQISQLVRCI